MTGWLVFGVYVGVAAALAILGGFTTPPCSQERDNAMVVAGIWPVCLFALAIASPAFVVFGLAKLGELLRTAVEHKETSE